MSKELTVKGRQRKRFHFGGVVGGCVALTSGFEMTVVGRRQWVGGVGGGGAGTVLPGILSHDGFIK